ncbi:hypothetical protein THIOSC15_670013 [uncultured Thiomicrorhabdus sp.]
MSAKKAYIDAVNVLLSGLDVKTDNELESETRLRDELNKKAQELKSTVNILTFNSLYKDLRVKSGSVGGDIAKDEVLLALEESIDEILERGFASLILGKMHSMERTDFVVDSRTPGGKNLKYKIEILEVD